MSWLSGFFRQYMIAVRGVGVFINVAFGYCGVLLFLVFIHKLTGNQVLNEQIQL
jgi:hypothetical protein